MKTIIASCLTICLLLSANASYAGGGHNRHHGGHHGGHSTRDFIGGLIFANVLGHIIHNHRNHDNRRTRTIVETIDDVDQWLLLDLSGRCFYVSRQDDGTEVRKEIEKEKCEM